MKDIQASLKGEILEELENLKGIDLVTDEHKTVIEGIAKLADKFIDLEKVDIDRDDKEERRELDVSKFEADNDDKTSRRELEINRFEAETEDMVSKRNLEERKFEADNDDRVQEKDFRTRQLDNDERDSWIRNGLTVVSIILPIGVTIWGTMKTLKFEETGTVTTIMGRGFINKLLPKK